MFIEDITSYRFAVVQRYSPSENINTFWATAETATLHRMYIQYNVWYTAFVNNMHQYTSIVITI